VLPEWINHNPAANVLALNGDNPLNFVSALRRPVLKGVSLLTGEKQAKTTFVFSSLSIRFICQKLACYQGATCEADR
jgi:hypothetical protein